MNNTDRIKKVLPSIAVSIMILIVAVLFQPSYGSFLALISCLIIGEKLWIYRKDLKKVFSWHTIKSLLIGLIVFTIIYCYAIYTKGYGILGAVVFVLSIVAYRLIKNRKQYISDLRYIESKIFGKPLDRSEWKDHKPRLPKVRLKK